MSDMSDRERRTERIYIRCSKKTKKKWDEIRRKLYADYGYTAEDVLLIALDCLVERLKIPIGKVF